MLKCLEAVNVTALCGKRNIDDGLKMKNLDIGKYFQTAKVSSR